MTQRFRGSVSGRNRLIIDGKNNESRTVGPGEFHATYEKSFELRDLDAPENTGGGSAQPTPDPMQGT